MRRAAKGAAELSRTIFSPLYPMKTLLFLMLGALLLHSVDAREPAEATAAAINRVSAENFSDKRSALEVLKQAQQGDARSAWEIACLLSDLALGGEITYDESMPLSLHWMRLAAKGGCAYAMIDMQAFIDGPRGGSVSSKEAEESVARGFHLLEEKAAKGSADARDYLYLSQCCLNGCGTAKNAARAREFYIKSLDANRELSPAQRERLLKRWDERQRLFSGEKG